MFIPPVLSEKIYVLIHPHIMCLVFVFFFRNRDIGLRENLQETTVSARNCRGFRGFPVNCPITQFRETKQDVIFSVSFRQANHGFSMIFHIYVSMLVSPEVYGGFLSLGVRKSSMLLGFSITNHPANVGKTIINHPPQVVWLPFPNGWFMALFYPH